MKIENFLSSPMMPEGGSSLGGEKINQSCHNSTITKVERED
jgi:hypothetical protein